MDVYEQIPMVGMTFSSMHVIRCLPSVGLGTQEREGSSCFFFLEHVSVLVHRFDSDVDARKPVLIRALCQEEGTGVHR